MQGVSQDKPDMTSHDVQGMSQSKSDMTSHDMQGVSQDKADMTSHDMQGVSQDKSDMTSHDMQGRSQYKSDVMDHSNAIGCSYDHDGCSYDHEETRGVRYHNKAIGLNHHNSDVTSHDHSHETNRWDSGQLKPLGNGKLTKLSSGRSHNHRLKSNLSNHGGTVEQWSCLKEVDQDPVLHNTSQYNTCNMLMSLLLPSGMDAYHMHMTSNAQTSWWIDSVLGL